MEERPTRQSGLRMAVGAAAASLASLYAWAALVIGSLVPEGWAQGWAYAGVALPAAVLGAAATQITGRRAFFWIGIAITLIPVAMMVVLGVEYDPRWNNEPLPGGSRD